MLHVVRYWSKLMRVLHSVRFILFALLQLIIIILIFMELSLFVRLEFFWARRD